jgi:hypothetical protein
MANKPVRVFTPVGTAIYPKLNEPDTKFNAEGTYSVKLAVPAAEAQQLIEKLEELRDSFYDEQDVKTKKTYTTVGVFEEELDDEGSETGNVIFRAKMAAHVKTKAGKEWDQRPALFDAKNNELDPALVKVGGGTRMRIQCEAVPYAMASSKTIGVSLRLRACQIIELRTYGGGSPFDEVEGEEIVVSKPASPFEADDAIDDEEDF